MTKRKGKRTEKYRNKRSSQIKKERAKREADLHISKLNNLHSNQICEKATKGELKRQTGRIVAFLLLFLRRTLMFIKLHKVMSSLIISIAVGAFYYFLPTITLTPGESLNQHNPFATPFILKNMGNQKLVNINCAIATDNDKGLNLSRVIIKNIKFTFSKHKDFNIKYLEPQSTSAIHIEHSFAGLPDNSVKEEQNIFLIVKYEPSIFIYRIFRKCCTKEFRFELRKNINNEYVWFERYE